MSPDIFYETTLSFDISFNSFYAVSERSTGCHFGAPHTQNRFNFYSKRLIKRRKISASIYCFICLTVNPYDMSYNARNYLFL